MADQRRSLLSRLFALVIIAVAIGSFILTAVYGNATIFIVSMEVIMGVGFLVSILTIIKMFKRAAREVKAENETKPDMASKYQQEIANVNTTAGYNNRMAVADHELKSWLRTVHAAPKSDIVKSIILLVWLLGTLFGGLILLGFSNGGDNQGLLIAGICSVACFPVTIIIAMIIVATRQRLSRRVDHNQPPMMGTVVSCTVSSQSSTGGRNIHRIMNTVYRMVVEVSGGGKLVTYTRRAYNVGDQVTVQPSRTRGLVTVVDNGEK